MAGGSGATDRPTGASANSLSYLSATNEVLGGRDEKGDSGRPLNDPQATVTRNTRATATKKKPNRRLLLS